MVADPVVGIAGDHAAPLPGLERAALVACELVGGGGWAAVLLRGQPTGGGEFRLWHRAHRHRPGVTLGDDFSVVALGRQAVGALTSVRPFTHL
eukprot:gene5805-6718_t